MMRCIGDAASVKIRIPRGLRGHTPTGKESPGPPALFKVPDVIRVAIQHAEDLILNPEDRLLHPVQIVDRLLILSYVPSNLKPLFQRDDLVVTDRLSA